MWEQYAFELRTEKGQAEETKKQVLFNVTQTLERAPGWRVRLRQLANPPVGSKDDDLSALKDDPDLRKLLGMDSPALSA